MRPSRVEVEPKEIAWCGPEVVVRLDNDPSFYGRQCQGQSSDFL